MGKVKVHVFTMAYNAQATLGRAIESILNQTFRDLEYYILDNGSDDQTWDIMLRYAKSDKRIVPLNVSKNDPTNGWAIFRTIINVTNADYIMWCDADDAYTLDFLRNMVRFSEEYSLDIAAGGYDMINGNTGKIEKHKVLENNLIVYGSRFKDEFINYRGFISYLWGKLYSSSFLKSADYARPPGKARTCNDTIWTLNMFQKADRIGIYGKAMYKYYQYHNSLSHRNIEDGLSSYRDLWTATKEYLEYYGPVSKLNEDFLYAIYLSLVDEAVGNIFAGEMDTEKKLGLLEKVFNDPVWTDTLKRDADPMFRNLAVRQEFVYGIKDKILSLSEIEKYAAQKQCLFSYLGIL